MPEVRNRQVASFRQPLVAGRTVMDEATIDVIYRPYGMDAWILNCTTAGEGRINSGPNLFLCSKGDLLLFPPRVPHDYTKHRPDGSWAHLWVYFVPRASWEPWLQWPAATGGVMRTRVGDVSIWQRIAKRMAEVIQLSRTGLSERHELCMNALEEVLLWCRTAQPGTGGRPYDPRVRAALEYIWKNYTLPVTVDDLARISSLTPSRIAHLFAAQVSMPPRQYLEHYRVTVAQELLISTDKPVRAIAAEAGFGDPLYFSRVFRNQTGRSPREYRKGSRPA